MRLHRPYIPLAVRVMVAERQVVEAGFKLNRWPRGTDGNRLAALLECLFKDKKFALDHDPALINREQRKWHDGSTYYIPDANNPDFLRYRVAGPGSDHDIKTRVRGDGAQLSDLAIARKRKRKERKAKRPKTKWPSRPFPKQKGVLRWRSSRSASRAKGSTA